MPAQIHWLRHRLSGDSIVKNTTQWKKPREFHAESNFNQPLHLSIETDILQDEVYMEHPPPQTTLTISSSSTVLMDAGFYGKF